MPSKLVKKYSNVLTTTIVTINNKCLLEEMPDEMKAAIITPILKKAYLDSETHTSYRPISTLCFLSKQVERIVANQLTAHMHKNNLHMQLQSAYSVENCSTETALLHVHDYVIHVLTDAKVWYCYLI